MKERHTLGPWESTDSTEDFQGHFIFGNGRTVAATLTEEACEITTEDFANCSLIVAAPAMLTALRQIANAADSVQEDSATEPGQRLARIGKQARAAIQIYERLLLAPAETEEEKT
jgi:hypothetical protein